MKEKAEMVQLRCTGNNHNYGWQTDQEQVGFLCASKCPNAEGYVGEIKKTKPKTPKHSAKELTD
jgi:hypothetical protein